MQKFPEDELTKRRRAMMSSETVLDYKKRMDDAKAEVEARGRMEEAEKWAKIAEELKTGMKIFYDMHFLERPGVKEMWPDHVFSCRAAEHSCPICESQKHANFKSLPSLEYRSKIIGVDWAKKPARTVMADFDPSSTELRIAAELSGKADKAVRDQVDRTFLDMLEKLLPVNPGGARPHPWPPAWTDPLYKIEGTRRNMHDDFVRRMQRELRSDMPFMRVTCSDPSKSKADVWKAVKDFLDKTKRDRTAIPMLPADIKIEPYTRPPPEYGIPSAWNDAYRVLQQTPPRTPLFYNEVLGEYSGQHAPGRVDAIYKEYNAKSTSFSERGIRGHRIDFAAIDEVQSHQELGVLAQKLYAEGKISRETMLKYAEEVKDESRSDGAVREPEGKGRDEEV